MQRVYLETEHQELFHLQSDLHAPIDVHIPSALAPLGYYICLHVKDDDVPLLDHVITHVDVRGLNSTQKAFAPGENISGPAVYASTVAGHSWRLLCRPLISRGEGTIRFEKMPSHLTTGDVLICTWPRFMESGQADEYIACQRDPQWAPSGVPLGGIGTGKVDICRDGRFRNFSGNNNQDMPFEEPAGIDGAFVSLAGLTLQHIALTSSPVGRLKPCPSLTAEQHFPQATLFARNALPSLDVTLHFSGPLVPHDISTSCLPGFVLRATLKNRGSEREATLALHWPNLVGSGGGIGEAETRIGYGDGFYRYWPSPGAPKAEALLGKNYRGLKYSNEPSGVSPTADGHHYVLVKTKDHAGISVNTDERRGSVAQTVTIPALGSVEIEFAVVWEMRRYVDLTGVDRGQHWMNICPTSESLLETMVGKIDEILNRAGELRGLLQDTDLPPWLQSRLSNCNYPLVTNSVFYPDGRFSINEGPTEMAACFGTIDQRLGAHPATQAFFPRLNATELTLFGNIQGEHGGIQHDLGGGHLERPPGETTWPDLTCSFILQCARHAWSTGDAKFEELAWPRVKKALQRHGLWADAGKGVAQVGNGMGTSYDGYHYYGTTPYMATLWLAALQVCRRWAAIRGEENLLPQIEQWIDAAKKRMDADLWNGSFYRAYGSAGGKVNENAHAGMLAGEYYSRMLAGIDVLPADRLKPCSDAIVNLNLSDKFVTPPDEVKPNGDAGTDYGWLPYVECFGLAALAVQGDLRMMPAWQRMIGAMERGGASVCDTKLMYRPNGEQNWGAYYMTAPASWLVYDALLDFFYRPKDASLRLIPKLAGKFAVVHPLFWGIGEQQGSRTTLTIRKLFGIDALDVRQLEVLSGKSCAYNVMPVAPRKLGVGESLSWDVV